VILVTRTHEPSIARALHGSIAPYGYPSGLAIGGAAPIEMVPLFMCGSTSVSAQWADRRARPSTHRRLSHRRLIHSATPVAHSRPGQLTLICPAGKVQR